ncbi:LSU ribosomal protein L21p [Candidatus Karelsulcia muelleri]|uniref:Large ribosomal subunit protein bL21 n=1 Tax=Candidatus Karelsulcia muelleri TaxID=336810 RepID=A0A654M2Q3_9FLAO|nr:50S ribosomal protein L21 [Candidatus Karelsulcia muelleri]AGS33399.1 50S ribosomal subunit protein L21 [Candidatus Karelsulcia muelleri str. Sulcia-ALF]ALP70139.1 LSU ribosomal protein L21p [Candidatus Karelsulcia muelleri]QND78385.1 LSU ribosomal protein L21 [Candidatus Karelsulcia muelleri]
MEAIFELLGYQYKASLNWDIYIPLLKGYNKGKNIFIKKILFIKKNGLIINGLPYIKRGIIKAKILKHIRDKKQIFLKSKKRKGFKLKKGHRRYLTKIKILYIEF